jgi:hypothetical protein
MPQAMRRAADPAPPADVAAVTPPVAEAAATPEEAAPSIAALAQADTPLPQARSLGSRSAQLAVPEAAGIAAAPAEAAPPVAMSLKMAPPTAVAIDVPPPPKLIPPEGYVRLWIDIVDTTKSATTEPSAEGISP